MAESAKQVDTISIVEQGDEPGSYPSSFNSESQLQRFDIIKAADTLAMKSKQIAGLQFSQIIEEEHESESAATSSVNHSRCASSILLHATGNANANATVTNLRVTQNAPSDL